VILEELKWPKYIIIIRDANCHKIFSCENFAIDVDIEQYLKLLKSTVNTLPIDKIHCIPRIK